MIRIWYGLYIDENGDERMCVITQAADGPEEAMDAETGEKIDVPAYKTVEPDDEDRPLEPREGDEIVNLTLTRTQFGHLKLWTEYIAYRMESEADPAQPYHAQFNAIGKHVRFRVIPDPPVGPDDGDDVVPTGD